MSLFGNKKDKKNKNGEKPHLFFSRGKKRVEAEPDAIYVKKNTPASREIKGYMRAVPIVLVAFAIFTTVCLVSGSEVGSFGSFFADFLKGLFSYMAYVIPVLMVIHALFYLKDVKNGRVIGRTALSVILLLTLAELAYLIPNFNAELVFDMNKFYQDGVMMVGGGFFGGVIGYALINVVGKIGVIIFMALVFVLYIVYCFSGKDSALKKIAISALRKVLNNIAEAERKHNEKKEKQRQKREQRAAKAKAKADAKALAREEARGGSIGKRTASELMDDDFFSARNGVSTLEIPKLGIYETKDGALGETVDNLRSGFDKQMPEDIMPENSERVYGDFDENDGDFVRDTNVSSDGTIFFDIRKGTGQPKNPYGLDDSADSVFTEEFDPYELATNEKYAYKPSSKAPDEVKTATVTEELGELTPRQLAREKMAREFEERKRQEQRRLAEEETRKEALRVAEELRRKEEEERRIEEQRLERERIERQRAAEEEQRRRREDAERISDYSRFGQDNPTFTKGFRANNPFRFVEAIDDTQPASVPTRQTQTYSDTVYKEASPAVDRYDFTDSSSEVGNSYTPPTQEPEVVRPASYQSVAAPAVEQPRATFDERSYESVSTPTQQSAPIREFVPTQVFEEKQPESVSSITLTRERLNENPPVAQPAPAKVGLDFSDDEDDEDIPESELEPEVIEDKVEIPEDERNPAVEGFKSMFDIFSGKDGGEQVANASEDDVIDEDVSDEDVDDKEPPFLPTYEDTTPKEAPKAPDKKPLKKKKDYSKYSFPPIDLLAPAPPEDTDKIQAEIYECSEKLVSTLDSFGITATVRGVDRGPRITRYSVVPAKGISVNQISKKEDDLAYALAAQSIRIEAPIPGKSAVGIEVPNKVASIVSLRELIESPAFTQKASKTAVCIGKSVEGETIFGDVSDMPHLLIAGATGMGKSVCMNSLITSILYRAKPDEVKFIMIDPKLVEFAPYNGIPHLLVPVVTDPKQAAGALDWAVQEMNKRYGIIQKLAVRNIDSYNERVAQSPELGEPMSKIIIFIDELNDLMISMRDPVENLITLIAQKARAAGIHLVIGTQRPSVNVITGVIKANIPSRIACKVASQVDSRTILERVGAESLIGRGDMLFVDGKSPNAKRLQGAYVSEKETEIIVEYIKKQVGEATYDEQAIEDIRKAAQKCDKSNDDGDDFSSGGGDVTGCLRDRKFLASVEMSIRNGSVATSWLQRRMSIGYSKAAQYIDNMEELGIVSEKNGSKARDILISLDEWHEKLSRLTSID